MECNYFITVFCGYNEYGPYDMRCWGYYPNLEDAIDTLTNNITDLWEACYTYGVIERIGPGIAAYAEKCGFYKYNANIDKYEPIDEPEELKHYCNFAIG